MKLLKFYAQWCKPCKKQSELLENFTTIPVESYDIDDTENEELVFSYRIVSLPTLILLKDDKEVKRFVGFTPLSKIERAINTAN